MGDAVAPRQFTHGQSSTLLVTPKAQCAARALRVASTHHGGPQQHWDEPHAHAGVNDGRWDRRVSGGVDLHAALDGEGAVGVGLAAPGLRVVGPAEGGVAQRHDGRGGQHERGVAVLQAPRRRRVRQWLAREHRPLRRASAGQPERREEQGGQAARCSGSPGWHHSQLQQVNAICPSRPGCVSGAVDPGDLA